MTRFNLFETLEGPWKVWPARIPKLHSCINVLDYGTCTVLYLFHTTVYKRFGRHAVQRSTTYPSTLRVVLEYQVHGTAARMHDNMPIAINCFSSSGVPLKYIELQYWRAQQYQNVVVSTLTISVYWTYHTELEYKTVHHFHMVWCLKSWEGAEIWA